MTGFRDHYLAWLRDAHAIEEQAQGLLEGCAGRLEDYPELHDLLIRHAKATAGHGDAIRKCIERHGESGSLLKDMVARITATAETLSGLFVGDEVMKALMAIYTFQHMKISGYRILISAAQTMGDGSTERLFEDMVEREEAFAVNLKDLIPTLTVEFIEREGKARV